MTDANHPTAYALKTAHVKQNDEAAEQNAQWKAFVRNLHGRPALPFDEHWQKFQDIFAGRPVSAGPPEAWQPDDDTLKTANITTMMQEIGISTYAEFYAWTVEHRAAFWEKTIARLGIRFDTPPEAILDTASGGIKNPDWLTGAVFNCTDSCFGADPDKTAIISGDEKGGTCRKTSYGELEKLVNRVANGLRENGFSAGDAIALYMPMTVECVAAYLGIIRAGCVAVSIADSFSPAELQKRLRIAGATGIFSFSNYKRAGRKIPLYDRVHAAGAPRAIVISRDEATSLRPGDMHWDDFLGEHSTFESVRARPGSTTNILFSSGTTGEPKAIPWTHLTPLKAAADGHYHQDIHDTDTVGWPTNIGWMMGPWLIYATFMNRAAMALFEGAPAGESWASFVREANITVLGVIPSLVKNWKNRECVQWNGWPKVRVFSSTGEPSNRMDYLWLMSRTGYRAPVIEYLGGTEIGGGYITGTVVQPASPATFTTPALGLDFVCLSEAGQPTTPGESGELFLIPPSIGLSQTLLNRDHEDEYYAGCPAGPKGETLRRHGDHILWMQGGYYKAQGRADDTMNLGGIKISSLEIERVINQHKMVYESAAIAVQPEGEGQEKLVIFAVSSDCQSQSHLQAELAKLISQKLNPLFKIYQLILVENLPRTASNKIMRRTLRAHFESTDK